jgi:(2Fe-2S) ferredoxin
MEFYRSHVLICGGTGCHSSGSADVMDSFKTELAKNNLENEIKLVQTGCFGLCAIGPVVIVYPEGAFYSQIKPEDVPRIVSPNTC